MATTTTYSRTLMRFRCRNYIEPDGYEQIPSESQFCVTVSYANDAGGGLGGDGGHGRGGGSASAVLGQPVVIRRDVLDEDSS